MNFNGTLPYRFDILHEDAFKVTSVRIDLLSVADMRACVEIGEAIWGQTTGADLALQLNAQFDRNSYSPRWLVATTHHGEVIGFAGYRRSWIMADAWELIWSAVAPEWRGHQVGRLLTELRLHLIEREGGSMITLMTKSPGFYRRFRFDYGAVYDGQQMMTKRLRAVKLGG